MRHGTGSMQGRGSSGQGFARVCWVHSTPAKAARPHQHHVWPDQHALAHKIVDFDAGVAGIGVAQRGYVVEAVGGR